MISEVFTLVYGWTFAILKWNIIIIICPYFLSFALVKKNKFYSCAWKFIKHVLTAWNSNQMEKYAYHLTTDENKVSEEVCPLAA